MQAGVVLGDKAGGLVSLGDPPGFATIFVVDAATCEVLAGVKPPGQVDGAIYVLAFMFCSDCSRAASNPLSFISYAPIRPVPGRREVRNALQLDKVL